MKSVRFLLYGAFLTAFLAFGACSKSPDDTPPPADDAYVILGATELTFVGAGESASVTVESNYDWDYSYDTSVSWFTIERGLSDITVTVTEDNSDLDERESVVTVTSSNGEGSTAVATFTVIESGAQIDPLVLVYNISDPGTQVTLPLSGTVDCRVDWGDGENGTVTSACPTHTFSAAGEYKVIVRGSATALCSSDFSTADSPVTTLTAVEQWGDMGLTSLAGAFSHCTSLATIPDDTEGYFAGVESFQGAFEYCSALTEIPSGLFKSATKATDFSDLFIDCVTLTSIPDGLFEENADAGTFGQTFMGCSGITSIPSSIFSGCFNVTIFASTFNGCTSVTGEAPYDKVDINGTVTTIKLYERNGYHYIEPYYAYIDDYTDCFADCSGLTDYGDIPELWGGSSDAPPDDGPPAPANYNGN